MSLYHVHSYYSNTSSLNGHTHCLSGTTSYAYLAGNSHVHHYLGTTTYDGHVHKYEGTTGPAVALPDGDHTHQYYGFTSIDDKHAHEFNDQTEEKNTGNIFTNKFN